MEGLIVRPWIVAVSGYGEHTYYTRSRGKALSQAWQCDAFMDRSFGDFLKITNAYAGLGDPERFGEQIEVGGQPAFFISCNRQYIQFVRPNSDVILDTHPLDVEPPEARRGTPYYVARAVSPDGGDALKTKGMGDDVEA